MENNKSEKRWFTADSIASAIAFIVLGVLFILLPESFSSIIVVVLGILLVVGGIVSVTVFFSRAAKRSAPDYLLVPALALLALGIYCLTHVSVIKELLSVLFGLLIIISGSFLLARACSLIRSKVGGFIVPLVLSLLTIVLGAIVLFGNFGTVMVVTGIMMIIIGVFNIAGTIMLNHLAGKVAKITGGAKDVCVDAEASDIHENTPEAEGAAANTAADTAQGAAEDAANAASQAADAASDTAQGAAEDAANAASQAAAGETESNQNAD